MLFVDNTAMHLDVATAIRGILHTDKLSTWAQPAEFELSEDGSHDEVA